LCFKSYKIICMKTIKLFVEADWDKIILSNILQAANFPVSNIEFEVASGKSNAIQFARNSAAHNPENKIIAAFLDADTRYVHDAKIHVKQYFNGLPVEAFFAVPTIESWLFADDDLIKKYVSPKHLIPIERLPFPEEITLPKEVYKRYLKKNTASSLNDEYAFLLEMNVGRAAARCPSLSHFLRRIGELLNVAPEILAPIENALTPMMHSKLFEGLLKEVATPDTVVFRTLEGQKITAEVLRSEIESGSARGKEYISNVLRVARDIIKQQTNDAL
jgi:Domain of unknown function (DUF4276)